MCAFVRLHFGKPTGDAVEEDAAVAMPSACLVNVMTTAAHWPPPTARMVAAAISAPWPVSSQHAAHFWDLSRAPRRYSGLNSGNWFVNILKRGSAADFKPVILHFQRICCSCWTADYCTYRNHLLAVSCCGKVATFQSWINSYYPRSNCFIDIVTRKLKHPEELLLY